MHKVRILLHGQLVVQAVVHEDMCSENSGEPADASLLTIQGMTACSRTSMQLKKMLCCTSKVLVSIGQSKKMRRAGRTRH